MFKVAPNLYALVITKSPHHADPLFENPAASPESRSFHACYKILGPGYTNEAGFGGRVAAKGSRYCALQNGVSSFECSSA